MRVYPVLRHRRSKLLYIGTTRYCWRLISAGNGEYAHCGPTVHGKVQNFELVGVGYAFSGRLPAPTDVRLFA